MTKGGERFETSLCCRRGAHLTASQVQIETQIYQSVPCHVENILSVYNLFVSGQLYRESATTNNVYKRDPNEENR